MKNIYQILRVLDSERYFMRTKIFLLVIVTLSTSVWGGVVWPDFRGPGHDGMSDSTALPLTWSEEQNIKWKTPIRGVGWSSPVVLGDQIWITTSSETGEDLFAICVSYKSGEVLHDIKVFDNKKPPRINETNSYASSSPVIEKDRLYVHFGTFGTACLNTQSGKTLWERTDINSSCEEGFGSSPILFGDLLIVTMDGEDVQYLIALNKKTGKTVWKTDRATDYPKENDYRLAFCTPLIIDVDGKSQMISPGSKVVMAFNPTTGQELWQVNYSGWSNTPRPLAGFGMTFINTGFQEPELWAVHTNGSGNITDSHVAWKFKEHVSTISSPILLDGLIYFAADSGFATCVNAKTGEKVWQERIGGHYWASPISALGRIYFFSDKGKTTVIEAGRTFKKLATSKLDDGFMASPAIIGKSLILRTKKNLYRIEE